MSKSWAHFTAAVLFAIISENSEWEREREEERGEKRWKHRNPIPFHSFTFYFCLCLFSRSCVCVGGLWKIFTGQRLCTMVLMMFFPITIPAHIRAVKPNYNTYSNHTVLVCSRLLCRLVCSWPRLLKGLRGDL